VDRNHTYLGMDLSLINKKLCLSMVGHIQETIEEFLYEIKGKVNTPAAPNRFDKGDQPISPGPDEANSFHHKVAKVLWAAVNAHSDLLSTLLCLTCQVRLLIKEAYRF
jgi:hypothetical protein